MIYFNTDYMAGAHPKVMERLVQTNAEQTVGYGSDDYTARAKELVKQACTCCGSFLLIFLWQVAVGRAV